MPFATMDALLGRIQSLPYDYPPGTSAVQLSSVPAERHEEVLSMASRVTPLCDARLRDLLLGFLAHKRASGTSVEQTMYDSMTPRDLFTRLLHKRPLAFWGSADTKTKDVAYSCEH